ncbi:disease resistance (CC-NBS-LRR class) family protein [Trifolium pratense]|uniref:Disease resistance (CC-NBS-LRR class) family protein n=1 Tax=Trifolium pratense TaxID=57577 RepID=A0A2K3M5H5_TRIPR|nr:disease resistance (CC-NBS-LRR class) family protein [Trifolium pratense]
METFSHGVSNTPNLREVHVNDEDKDEWHWNGDLNSTIRKIVAKKDNQNSKDDYFVLKIWMMAQVDNSSRPLGVSTCFGCEATTMNP